MTTDNPETPAPPPATAPAEKPKRRAARKPRPQPTEPDIAGTAQQVAAPSISFFNDVSDRIAASAQAEIATIEADWAKMRERWIELTTLLAGIDAARAVVRGDPTTTDPDLDHPGGSEALEALQKALMGQPS